MNLILSCLFSDSVIEQENQRDKFFMLLALIRLRVDLSSVRDQILASPVIPTLDETFARLLRISSTTTETESESSVLAILKNSKQGDNKNGKGKALNLTVPIVLRAVIHVTLVGPFMVDLQGILRIIDLWLMWRNLKEMGFFLYQLLNLRDTIQLHYLGLIMMNS